MGNICESIFGKEIQFAIHVANVFLTVTFHNNFIIPRAFISLGIKLGLEVIENLIAQQ